jgi:hypothetical protein
MTETKTRLAFVALDVAPAKLDTLEGLPSDLRHDQGDHKIPPAVLVS